MYDYHIQGALTFANFFISAFITRYVWRFLKRTKQEKDRKPWELVYWASLFYFAHQIFHLLSLYENPFQYAEAYSYPKLITEFFYSGIILYTVVTQGDLILKKTKIVIRRKKR
ncbi:MAG TPA: hypothetical protein VJG90_08675 [Candidatus Nanoarchaeia archaeon]|nr:hypothetical protein [Candidatus Nanoarchaeia archaeon]